MTVNDLKVLLERAIEQGYGDAHIQVQADADSISDIMINGYEGFGEEFENGPKVFSIVSSEDKAQFERCYGPAEEIYVIYKVTINGSFVGVYILNRSYASNFNWGYKPDFIGTKEECESEAKRWNWKVLEFIPSGNVDNHLWHDFSQE